MMNEIPPRDFEYYRKIAWMIQVCEICCKGDVDLFFNDMGYYHKECLDEVKIVDKENINSSMFT